MLRNKTIKYKISKEDCAKIADFVEKRLGEDQSLYKKRGGFKEEDIWVGACAEVAASYFLKTKGIDVTPDFNIYGKGEKSFEADLKQEHLKFHVKGQSLRSAKLYGHSWLLQRYDKIVKEPLKNHYLILCKVDVDNMEVEIMGVVSQMALHKKGAFGECKHPAFRITKVAIYLESLYDKLSNKQMWGI